MTSPHCPCVHKQKRHHCHAKMTVHWRTTHSTWHISLEILRFPSAIHRHCGHFYCSCSQASGPARSLAASTERKWKHRSYITKMLSRYPLITEIINIYTPPPNIKERCQAKFLDGHLIELGLLIGPHKSARFVWANQEAKFIQMSLQKFRLTSLF